MAHILITQFNSENHASTVDTGIVSEFHMESGKTPEQLSATSFSNEDSLSALLHCKVWDTIIQLELGRIMLTAVLH